MVGTEVFIPYPMPPLWSFHIQLQYPIQWQIQDLTDGGAWPWVWAKNLLFDKIFAENLDEKLGKEIALRGASPDFLSEIFPSGYIKLKEGTNVFPILQII